MIRARLLPVLDAALEPADRFAGVDWTGTTVAHFISLYGNPDWRDMVHLDARSARDAISQQDLEGSVGEMDRRHVEVIHTAVNEVHTIVGTLTHHGYEMAVPPASARRPGCKPLLVRWKHEPPPNPASSLHVVLAVSLNQLERVISRNAALAAILESV